jgi:predicted metal-binding membrane protein
LETILRRERLIVASCLAIMTALAWFYLFRTNTTGMSDMTMSHMDMSGPSMDMAGMPMAGMSGMVLPDSHSAATSVVLLFVMWSVMMIAMMVPSAVPMILSFVALNRVRRLHSRALIPVGIFILGYLLIWSAFSIVAALAQYGLHRATLLSSAMVATSSLLNGALLLAAGVFQWTPLKRACLRGCRSPLSFLMSRWREGAGGALMMGLEHGTYCVGCCWVLMALLFVAGVMNLLWVAIIAVFIMAEKILPRGELVGRVAGIALAVSGVAVMVRFW